ncbi:MAG: CPBP family intramembrane metalloprotease [Bacteroidia bacterium]|nr:CPBP family intramembrane metalloprotease [Bacteroidia bacterium]MCX7764083.1 CPBP family intramembrane metalloprotease [Bacteroidia bacterium]MDW8057867.1 CPBP family intramembrane glutamic endopeptidase [Bacteroidia bacterium]
MRELLRLAALLGILGVTLFSTSFLISNIVEDPAKITTAADAHRMSGGNALMLLLSFGLTGLLYLTVIRPDHEQNLLKSLGTSLSTYWLLAVFMLGIFFILPWLGLDAESFQLPPSLHEIEELLELQEAQIEVLMRSLIRYGNLFFLLLTMALAPAVAEELFFRGALQTQFSYLMNRHMAVWLTAFIFSAIHFQVYGFIPRLLLGAIMGYLTLWTKSLAPAIWAHFLNNAYATIVAYLGMHVFDSPEWIDSTYRPPLWTALLGAVIAGGVGYHLFRRLHRA